MKRSILFAALLGLLLFGFGPVGISLDDASAQTGATATITAWHLNVRDYPSPTTGEVIARVGRGEVYNVTARSSFNDWWRLALPDGRQGWVNGFYISLANAHLVPTITPERPSIIPGTAIVTAAHLNVRAIPNPVSGEIIARVGRGEVYQIIGRNANSSWWQIRLPDGRQGWVNAGYISASNTAGVPQTDSTVPTGQGGPAPTAVPTTTNGTVTAFFLNVRAIPNPVAGNVIAVIGRGQSYTVIGRNANSTWYQIRIGNTAGWVSGAFFSVNNPAILPVTG